MSAIQNAIRKSDAGAEAAGASLSSHRLAQTEFGGKKRAVLRGVQGGPRGSVAREEGREPAQAACAYAKTNVKTVVMRPCPQSGRHPRRGGGAAALQHRTARSWLRRAIAPASGR